MWSDYLGDLGSRLDEIDIILPDASADLNQAGVDRLSALLDWDPPLSAPPIPAELQGAAQELSLRLGEAIVRIDTVAKRKAGQAALAGRHQATSGEHSAFLDVSG